MNTCRYRWGAGRGRILSWQAVDHVNRMPQHFAQRARQHGAHAMGWPIALTVAWRLDQRTSPAAVLLERPQAQGWIRA